MFFFFEDQNPLISGMAFESYVINVLSNYLSAQGKTLTQENESGMFDALLPDGIDDIEGPLHLKIKAGLCSQSGYFRNIEHFAPRVCDAPPGAVLFILEMAFSAKSKQSLKRMVENKSKRKAYILDIEDFNKLTEGYSQEFKEYIESPAKAIVDEAINNPLSEPELVKAQSALISALKREYQKEELALFVGAGISKDAGIPQWKDLVNSLLSKMILSRTKGKVSKGFTQHLDTIIHLAHQNQENSPITQIRYIKGAFSSDEYNKLVHEVLYSKKPQPNTALLNAIAAICTPRRNHIGVQGVVTYNFDDLLERCLDSLKVQTNIVSCEDDISTPDKLSIFHVHGYMPNKFDDSNPNMELILSEEDYHKVYRDAYCWSNLIQLNYLREHTCLFIGCSLTDPNLRRLLDVAKRNNEKPRHFAFLRRNDMVNNSGVDQRALEIYKDIDLNLREKYYAAMGLNIIWVDHFNEIPNILRSLL